MSTVLVTGGCGFIGSALVRHLISEGQTVINIDSMTYAATEGSVSSVASNPLYRFIKADITDAEAMQAAFAQHQPDTIIHLAAESHVDRSIDGPEAFLHTNIMGTYVLLQAARGYYSSLAGDKKEAFRFLLTSTDEVYGSLGQDGLFTENTAYAPNSPYSASKASADHLARAWHHTYGLPVIITNCSNNYGPYHFPEKLIPLIIINALESKPLPVYGDGSNVRDWLYVDDHARGLWLAAQRGKPGEKYNIGGNNERSNLQVVHTVCDILDDTMPQEGGRSRRELITFVGDRPGHDFRYAIDAAKIRRELGWQPQHDFDSGIRRTVQWYRDNAHWWHPLRGTVYQGQRLGAAA